MRPRIAGAGAGRGRSSHQTLPTRHKTEGNDVTRVDEEFEEIFVERSRLESLPRGQQSEENKRADKGENMNTESRQ